MILVLALQLATLPVAAVPMPALPPDPHIRIVDYSPTQVVPLTIGAGFAAVVELSPDERADSVVVGNTAGWQVTATKRGDSVVVKPLANAAATDMVVVTATRRYVFLLEPDGGAGLFVVRFTYPGSDAPAVSTTPVATFKFRGAQELFPAAMHDDGKRTVVTWSAGTLLPAMFAITRDGREAIVNGRMADGDYIVETTAPRFVFRLGNTQAVAVRKTVKHR